MSGLSIRQSLVIFVCALLVTISFIQQASAGVCPAGFKPAKIGCAMCGKGTYSEKGNACETAPAGYFVDAKKAKKPTPCPLGTYNPDSGMKKESDCLKAEAGYYVGQQGATQQTACEIGSYNDKEGQSVCVQAGLGYYVTTVGATSQTACPDGKESLVEGASSCTLIKGAEAQVKCLSGISSADKGKSPWQVCWTS